MHNPSPRVWLVTFVTLVFTIGLLAGIVLERTVLHRSDTVMRGLGPVTGGPGSPGGRGGPGRGGSGAPNGRGQGRGGPMFGPPPTQYVEDLSREVQLTDAQRTEILALLRAQEAHLQAMQQDARQVFIAEQAGLHDRIAAVLTPDQASTFRTWVTRRIGPRSGGPR